MYEIANITFVQAGDLIDLGSVDGRPGSDVDGGEPRRVRMRQRTYPGPSPATSDTHPRVQRNQARLTG